MRACAADLRRLVGSLHARTCSVVVDRSMPGVRVGAAAARKWRTCDHLRVARPTKARRRHWRHCAPRLHQLRLAVQLRPSARPGRPRHRIRPRPCGPRCPLPPLPGRCPAATPPPPALPRPVLAAPSALEIFGLRLPRTIQHEARRAAPKDGRCGPTSSTRTLRTPDPEAPQLVRPNTYRSPRRLGKPRIKAKSRFWVKHLHDSAERCRPLTPGPDLWITTLPQVFCSARQGQQIFSFPQ
jgi:hypothetical protein